MNKKETSWFLNRKARKICLTIWTNNILVPLLPSYSLPSFRHARFLGSYLISQSEKDMHLVLKHVSYLLLLMVANLEWNKVEYASGRKYC